MPTHPDTENDRQECFENILYATSQGNYEFVAMMENLFPPSINEETGEDENLTLAEKLTLGMCWYCEHEALGSDRDYVVGNVFGNNLPEYLTDNRPEDWFDDPEEVSSPHAQLFQAILADGAPEDVTRLLQEFLSAADLSPNRPLTHEESIETLAQFLLYGFQWYTER